MRHALRGKRRIRIAAASALALVLTGAGVTAFAAQNDSTNGSAATTSRSELVKRVKEAAAAKNITEPTADAVAGTGAEPATGSGNLTRIIGGSTTSTSGFMMQLWYDDESTGESYFCGGTLIAPTKVLTAGHCVSGLDWAAHGTVIGGTATLADTTNGTVVGVRRQWLHPSYSDTTIQNDLAVLTLAKPLGFKTAQLVASDDTARYAPGTTATAYGWGLTSDADDPNADLSATLKTATVPVVDDATCDAAMLPITGGEDIFTAGKMFCASEPGTGSDADTTATCHGDSGGPLIVNGRLTGIVSWGSYNCVEEGGYDVYTKVSTYTAAALARMDDANLNGDANADLLAFDSISSNKAYAYDSKGTSFAARRTLSSFWGPYNLAVQTDLNRDGHQDFIIRNRDTGIVYWRHRSVSSSTYVNTKIAGGWQTRRAIVAPGDVTGDQLPDLLAVDETGKLTVYPGKGNGTFAAAVTGGTGYKAYFRVIGKGDYNSDGRNDLIVQGSGDVVSLLAGTGQASAPFAAPAKIGTWSGYNRIAAPGDITGDGTADLVARTTAGTLYLYKGTGSKTATATFATRLANGGDWSGYRVIS